MAAHFGVHGKAACCISSTNSSMIELELLMHDDDLDSTMNYLHCMRLSTASSNHTE
jgi:hypothetical protein